MINKNFALLLHLLIHHYLCSLLFQHIWNDALRYKIFVQQEARLLEAVYERNGKERMKIFKDEERKKYIAISQDTQFNDPFFEADSLKEAAILVKNYGFQAVDKEDRIKYQIEKTPERKKQETLMMSR